MGDYWGVEVAPADKGKGGDVAGEIEAALGDGEESIASLAEQTGVKDPVALAKLIKKIVEAC